MNKIELLKAFVDQLPLILVGLGFVVWALARFVEAKAKANPEKDGWDEAAPKLTWAAKLISQAIDWLADTNNLKLGPNQTKLSELNRLVTEFEKKVSEGKYVEAVSEVMGYWTAAKNKVPLLPMTGSEKPGDSKSQ